MLVVAAVLVWSFTYKLNEYAITPGLSQPVGPLITVTDHPRAPVRRTIYLTDVYLTQLTIWQWLSYTIHPSHDQLISGNLLTGGNVPASELTAQGYLQMYDSQNYAKVAGMRALGLRVPGTAAGAVVTGISSRSPALHALSVADRIVGARGEPVRDVCGLAKALEGVQPRASVPLDVQPAAISASGTITYGASRSLVVRTEAVPPKLASTGCPGVPDRTAWIGIGLEDAISWHFPVSVTINTAYIGGPSAGLAMALGTMDALSLRSLTGGTKVAATGTIDPLGNVGAVGGVPEKTIAVESAGARVFLVPSGPPNSCSTAPSSAQCEARQNYLDAVRAAAPSLHVVGVATLDQALRAIERYGGRSPVPITDASHAGATS